MELHKYELPEKIDGLTIIFEAEEEHISLENYCEGTDLDINQLTKQIANGDLVYFCAKVTANINDIELASDYLGCCCYVDYEEFYTKYKDDYFADMIKTVVEEAKETLRGI